MTIAVQGMENHPVFRNMSQPICIVHYPQDQQLEVENTSHKISSDAPSEKVKTNNRLPFTSNGPYILVFKLLVSRIPLQLNLSAKGKPNLDANKLHYFTAIHQID